MSSPSTARQHSRNDSKNPTRSATAIAEMAFKHPYSGENVRASRSELFMSCICDGKFYCSEFDHQWCILDELTCYSMLLDLDVKSLSGFSITPALDAISVDIERLIGSPPSDALNYLIALRFTGIAGQFAHFRSETTGSQRLSPLLLRMYHPVNPLLLATAISLSIVEKKDVSSFLTNYALGLETPGLEERLILINMANTREKLLRVLELEESFYRAVLELGTSILVKFGRLIQDHGTPTMPDLYWGCWLALNPIFQQDALPARLGEEPDVPPSMNGWRRGIKWGNHYNSLIHNAREHYEYKLGQANESINSLLASGARSDDGRAELEDVLNQQQVFSLLVQRARRLYFWAPHEISAFSAQATFAQEVNQTMRQDLLLPQNILQQIRLSNSRGENRYGSK